MPRINGSGIHFLTNSQNSYSYNSGTNIIYLEQNFSHVAFKSEENGHYYNQQPLATRQPYLEENQLKMTSFSRSQEIVGHEAKAPKSKIHNSKSFLMKITSQGHGPWLGSTGHFGCSLGSFELVPFKVLHQSTSFQVDSNKKGFVFVTVKQIILKHLKVGAKLQACLQGGEKRWCHGNVINQEKDF